MKSHNILIAEFIGLRWESKRNYTGWYKGNTRIASDDTLQYHSSWDWLMPVVEKIESFEFKCTIEFGLCIIEGENYYKQTYDGTKRKATYFAVVEFIKWYNENKK